MYIGERGVLSYGIQYGPSIRLVVIGLSDTVRLMAYPAYVWLLKIRPTTEVGTHAYVNPVVAVVIGGGLGGEQITGIQLLGLVIILGSVMLVNKKERINE